MNLRTSLSVMAVSAMTLAGTSTTAHGASGDSDGDGIPNRWERTHGLNPHRAADARRDPDGDRLTNLREYRLGSAIRDEDSDRDGHDDGDEVRDGLRATDIEDRDTDNDGTLDGDEDSDRDGFDNEDEDDAAERCSRDDDDDDDDSVDDEDENELGLKAWSTDSDRDGVDDGDEDSDEDGEANEDADDVEADACDGDRDGDGESEEDEDDVLGAIESFDAGTGTLVIRATAGYLITGTVTEDTEIELEHSDDSVEDSDEDGTTADLQPGVRVAEVEFDDETGALEEVEIYPATSS